MATVIPATSTTSEEITDCITLCQVEEKSLLVVRDTPNNLNKRLFTINIEHIASMLPSPNETKLLKSRIVDFFEFEYTTPEHLSSSIKSFNKDYFAQLRFELTKCVPPETHKVASQNESESPIEVTIKFKLKLFFEKDAKTFRTLEFLPPWPQELLQLCTADTLPECHLTTFKTWGLKNYRNNCFYNSAIQFVNILLELCQINLDEAMFFSEGISYYLVNKYSDDLDTKDGEQQKKARANNINGTAALLSVTPFQQDLDKMVDEALTHFKSSKKPELKQAIHAVIQFRIAANNLLKELSSHTQKRKVISHTQKRKVINDKHEEFHDAFICALRLQEKENVLQQFNAIGKPKHKISDIVRQGDSDEVIEAILQTLAVDNSPEFIYRDSNIIGLAKTIDTDKFETIKVIPTPAPKNCIIKVSTNSVDKHDLDAYLKKHTKLETQDEENSKTWLNCAENQTEHSFDQTEVDRVQKQVLLLSLNQVAPKFLIVSVRSTDMYGELTKPMVTLQHEKVAKDVTIQTCALFNAVQKQLVVQVPLNNDIESKQQVIDYKVKAVICHTGKNTKYGHYFVLKFEDDGSVIEINDSIVKCDFNYLTTLKGFEEWLITNNVGGIVYLLGKAASKE